MSNQQQKLRGVFGLLLTPFHSTGEIDWPTYDRYVDWQLGQEPHGLFASCGSSELRHLTARERVQLARRAVELAGETPVAAVANADPHVSTHADEVARMADTGVSAIVFIPPDGMGRDQSMLTDYFADLAGRSPVPVILYEIPSAHPKEIAPATYGTLVRETSVCGIKDTSGTVAGATAKMEAAPGGTVYQAVAPFLLDTLRAGGNGAMAIASTACPRLVVKLWDRAMQERSAGPGHDGSAVAALRADEPAALAEAAQRQLTYLNAVLELGYMATAKHLVSLHGIPMNAYCRSGRTLEPMAAKSIETWYHHYREGERDEH